MGVTLHSKIKQNEEEIKYLHAIFAVKFVWICMGKPITQNVVFGHWEVTHNPSRRK